MDCPRCTLPLRKIDLGEYKGEAAVVVDTCPQCQGTWLDRGEFDLRDESTWTDAEAVITQTGLVDHSALICPRCTVPLTSITLKEQPDLMLDRCPDCSGFWLDKGEVEQVQDMAAGIDAATMEDTVRVLRPPDWSWLRWTVYCARQYHSR